VRVDYELAAVPPRKPKKKKAASTAAATAASTAASTAATVAREGNEEEDEEEEEEEEKKTRVGGDDEQKRDTEKSDGVDEDEDEAVLAMAEWFGIRASVSGEYPRKLPVPFESVPRTAVRVKRRMTLTRADASALQVCFTIVKSARGPECSVYAATQARATSYEIEVEVPSTHFNRGRPRIVLLRDAMTLLCDVLHPVIDVNGIRALPPVGGHAT
jgi:hypothetical protein